MNQTLEVIAGLAVFVAAVSAMPEPTPASSQFYRWIYAFGHALTPMATRVINLKAPMLAVPDDVQVKQVTATRQVQVTETQSTLPKTPPA